MTYNLVPQFIIDKYNKNEVNGHFYATALFVDISGFSALADQLMKHGQHGTEVLAGVMGEIFEPLIDAVYSQGGFVTGFAGDAFTAVFPDITSSSAAQGIAAAVAIQEQMKARPEQDTPYSGYPMSAKVGVAAGEVIWGIVSAEDGQQASYYFQGTAIDGCAEAEHAARPGDIILDARSYGAVRNGSLTEAVGRFHRLIGITAPLPEPQTVPPPTANTEQLLRFVPRAVVRAGRTGEFRQVVNMFISLPTVRTEAQLDIFMQTVFTLQRKYGGLLKQLDYGDKGAKLLLFWGAPVAHENDIERALHFILDLQTQTAIPINGGITYHVAHAGYIGSSLRGEYTCYGRGVNLAARFMTGAPRGEIWVDEHIAYRAGGQFDLEFAGEESFKGFAEPQKVYILFERTDIPDAFYEGRLIGREADLARLSEFMAPIYEGHSPGMFVIWGEPGAGKSRLAHEFLSHHLPPGARTQVFLAQADEILRQSFNPFRYWLKRYFGQSEGLAESRNKRSFNRKLDHLIGETEDQPLADELDRLRSFLGALVGLYWPDSLYEQVDAKGRHEHTLSALSTLLQAESGRQPAVLLLEDTHWIDQDSASFLSDLLAELAQSDGPHFPLAILATARYEGGIAWLEDASYQEMTLSALDPSDLATFTRSYLDHPPADELLALVVERSEGNPFFAEQILRYLQESKQLEKVDGYWHLITGEESPLPGDVNALLVARLDRLARAVREVVQTAAVLGREFEIRVLSQMLHDEPTLPEKIAAAEQESIWSALNEIRYAFRHALLRDAAYRMQLRARRQALHQMALEALESLFEEDLSRRFGELAYHARAAGLLEPAFRYGLLAGNQAMETYAAAEAVNVYRPAMELLGQVETTPEQRRQLCARYGRALELTGDPAAALAHYEKMEQLALELSDQQLELDALVAQGTLRSTGNIMANFELGESLGQKGLGLAKTLNDKAAEVKILWNLSNVYRLTGRYQKALESGLQAFELAEAFNLREEMAYIANDLTRVYMGMGEISKMMANCRRTVELWREVDNRPMLVDGLANYGLTLALTGQLDTAMTVTEEGIALSQASNNLWGEAFMRYTPTLVHLQRLEMEAGLVHANAGLQLAEKGGVTIVQFYTGLLQFLLYLSKKQYSQALEIAQRSYSIAGQHLSFQKPAATGALAIVHIERGDLETAGELISSYEIDTEKLGVLLFLLPELAKCRYFLARGDYDDLLPITRSVVELAEEQGISLLIPQFCHIQGQAYLALGNREAAATSVQAGLSVLRRTGGRWGYSELAELMREIEQKAKQE